MPNVKSYQYVLINITKKVMRSKNPQKNKYTPSVAV